MKLSVWHERSKRTGMYSVRYYDPDTGDKKRIKCYDKIAMLATKARIQSMLLNRQTGRGDPDAIPLVVFEEYLDAIKNSEKLRRRQTTLDMKRKNLVPFLETLFKLSDLSTARIKDYVKAMQTKYKVDTVAIRLRDLRAFLNWCVKEKKMSESPFKGISIPASDFTGRRLTLPEIRLLFIHMEPPFREFFTLALETGARHGELLAAEWSEVDMYNKSWFIPAHKCKTRINRTIPLSERALVALDALPRGSRHVFEGWTRFKAQRLWKQALKASGIEGRVRIHDIRHTFASNWKGRAASLKLIAGWTTDQMMSKYTHTELAYLAEETQRSSAVWGEFGANPHKNDT